MITTAPYNHINEGGGKSFNVFVSVIDSEFPQLFNGVRNNFFTQNLNFKKDNGSFVSFHTQMYMHIASLIKCDKYQNLEDYEDEHPGDAPIYILDFMMKEENYNFLKFKYAL